MLDELRDLNIKPSLHFLNLSPSFDKNFVALFFFAGFFFVTPMCIKGLFRFNSMPSPIDVPSLLLTRDCLCSVQLHAFLNHDLDLLDR